MPHPLDNDKELAELACIAQLWIDGTSTEEGNESEGKFEGLLVGDATQGPWYVFDIAGQENVAGPFESGSEAVDALQAIIANRRAMAHE